MRVRKIPKRVYYFRYVCPSVLPSVCPHGTIVLLTEGFLLNFIFNSFRKSVQKIKFLLKPDKSNVYST